MRGGGGGGLPLEFLLSLMDVLPAESDTDDDFDGYLEEDESFVAQHLRQSCTPSDSY